MGGGVKLLKTDLQFKWINFQFCGMGEATEFSEIIKNLTKWCNVSTNVISKTKLLTRDFINHKNQSLQKAWLSVIQEY